MAVALLYKKQTRTKIHVTTNINIVLFSGRLYVFIRRIQETE